MSSTTERKCLVFRFSGIEVQERELRVLRDGAPLAVEPKAFRVLVCLLRKPRQLVGKDELIHAAWGDTAVTDNSLSRAIAHLRHVLEDDAREPRFIETVSTAGYRIVCPVVVVEDSGGDDVQLKQPAPKRAVGVDESNRFATAKFVVWGLAGAAFVAALAAGVWYLRRQLPPPRISEYVRLTNDGRTKTPVGTDGTRLFMFLFKPYEIAQVPVTGGKVEPISIPGTSFAFLLDVSPDGSKLLLRSGGADGIWTAGVLGDSLRHLADVPTVSVAWSPDGKSVAYSTPDGEIYRARNDWSDAQKLTTARREEPAESLAWSPDGETLRYTKADEIWEISSHGSKARKVIPMWEKPQWSCCGRWTRDGAFYIFLSGGSLTSGGDEFHRSQLWAQDERGGWPVRRRAQPVQLTSGPTRWGPPVPSLDSKRIFSEGVTLRGEVQKFDARSHGFEPFLGGISAEFLAFSKDGQSVAYVSYPDGILWKANRDGNAPVQLTDPPLYPTSVTWSPDGSEIAFFDSSKGLSYAVSYIVSVHGGKPRRLLAEEKGPVIDANWSPDGTKMVFETGQSMGSDRGQDFIRILDIATKQVTTLPGSEGMFSPRWSPDGRFIIVMSSVAPSFDKRVYDLEAKRWKVLPLGPSDWPTWSKDSKYVYFLHIGRDQAVVRVSIETGKIEKVIDLRGFPLTGSVLDWFGLDPDDAPLLLRNAGSDQVYALTLERK